MRLRAISNAPLASASPSSWVATTATISPGEWRSEDEPVALSTIPGPRANAPHIGAIARRDTGAPPTTTSIEVLTTTAAMTYRGISGAGRTASAGMKINSAAIVALEPT